MKDEFQNIIERFSNNNDRFTKIENYLGFSNNEGNGGLIEDINNLLILNSDNNDLFLENRINERTINFKNSINKEVIINNDYGKYINTIKISFKDSSFSEEFKTKYGEMFSDGYFDYYNSTPDNYHATYIKIIDYYEYIFRTYLYFDLYINDILFLNVKILIDLSGNTMSCDKKMPYITDTINKSANIGRLDIIMRQKKVDENFRNTNSIQVGIGLWHGIDEYYHNSPAPSFYGTIPNNLKSSLTTYFHIKTLYTNNIKLKNFRIDDNIMMEYKKGTDCSKSDINITNTLNELKRMYLENLNNVEFDISFQTCDYDDRYININNNYK